MAANPGSISAQPAANALTGGELLFIDQEIGSPVAATALVVNQGYRIVTLGTTNWQACGAGASAAVGTVFKCEAVGTGTGTAQRVDTRKATAQAIAALAGVAAAITAHGAEVDPHPGYTSAQELATALTAYLTTAAAAQAYQPLDADLTALANLAGQTAFGRAFLALVNEAGARDYIGIGPDDSLTLTGLALTGLATLPRIHGGLAGEVYAHVKNVSGGALAAGTPLRIVGTVGDTTTLEVAAADAASSATMPALFVLSQPLASNGDGHATMLGEITGINTAGLTPGAPLFVAAGGGLTATRPASNAQQVATVGRAHATTGSIHVLPWPMLLALGSSAPLGLAAVASAGTATTAAPSDHQHQRDATFVSFVLSGSQADPIGSATTVIESLPMPFSGTILAVSLYCETAVTTQPIIHNATLNGVSIYSTTPQINIGGTTISNTPVFSITAFNTGDILRLYLPQANGGGRMFKATYTIRRS